MRPIRLLGVRAHLATMAQLNQHIAETVERGARSVIANHNLHSVYLYHRDARMRALYAEADVVHIDGMGLIAAARLLGLPARREHRTTYVDWIGPLVERAAREGWRVFCLGSRPGIAERAASRFRERAPGLEIETAHGYFEFGASSRDDDLVVEKINAFRPHILLVGLGMPRQEHWIRYRLEDLAAHVILPCGACLDFAAGAVPTPPRWLGRVGLEWLYRLACDPRRLSRRYLVEPWLLVGLLALQRWRRRRPDRA